MVLIKYINVVSTSVDHTPPSLQLAEQSATFALVSELPDANVLDYHGLVIRFSNNTYRFALCEPWTDHLEARSSNQLS